LISRNYIYKTFKEHFSFLIFALLLVGSFQILMLTLVVEADILNITQIFFSKFPPQLQQFFGEEFIAQFSISGAVAFGYNHPIVLIFLAIIAIMLPAKHIAGEIEDGTLELLVSLPIKRIKLSFSLWILSVLMPLIAIIGGWSGTLIGMMIYPQTSNLPFVKIFQIGINLWLLILTINGYTFLFSAYSREGNRVTLRAAGVTLFFFFLNYTVKLWSAVSFLKPFTIFSYYQPQQIVTGQASLIENIGILAALTTIFLIIAFRKINKMDIPG